MFNLRKIIKFHNGIKSGLISYINSGEASFEYCLALVKRTIRSDLRTISSDADLVENIASNLHDSVITIKVDTMNPKKTYIQIIDNIYVHSRLSDTLKGSGDFSKDEKMILLLEINFLKTYFGCSQDKIIKRLEKKKLIDIYTKKLDSKGVHRYIQLINKIKSTTDNIQPQNYKIYN